jgi:hypothetical protein
MSKHLAAQKAIGGYIELELPSGEEYYTKLIRLNTGRNALEYILKEKRYAKIYMPYFTCNVLLEPIKKLGIKNAFYRINDTLEPIIDFEIEEDACLLYTDYFGIKREAAERLNKEYSNLIVDNSQAFFSAPIPGVDTFYSCRKFFGVPDGAYLQLSKKTYRKLPADSSINRFSHLIKSIDLNIEAGYPDYLHNNKTLENNSIREMSPLTRRILSGVDYANCIKVRRRNFNYLHDHLKPFNLLDINIADDDVPMVYPFLHENRQLKLDLIQKKIFVATYWPNVYEWTTGNMYENYLTRCLVPLPIDHRYSLQDMLFVIRTLKQFL